MPIEVDWCDYDVVVVGSGGAGSHAAQAAAATGARVLVVSKDPIGASDTKISRALRRCASPVRRRLGGDAVGEPEDGRW